MFRTRYFAEEEEIKRAPVTFHSRAGKKRLIKIWNSQRLSDECLFSSLSTYSNESALREIVTEYMQNYFQLRLQRFTMKNAYEYFYQLLNDSSSRKVEEKKFQTYYLNQKKDEQALKERMKQRCVQEEERVANLHKPNLVIPPPLENLEANYEQKPKLKEDVTVPVPTPISLLPVDSLTDDVISSSFSRSSGFYEPLTPSTPDNDNLISNEDDDKGKVSSSLTSNEAHKEEEEEEADSLLEDFNEEDTIKQLILTKQMSETDSAIIDGNEDENHAKLEKKLAVILSNEIEFHYVAPLILENIFKETDLIEMCNFGNNILQVYRREMAAATKFSNDLAALMTSNL